MSEILREKYRLIGLEWAEANATADILEHTKTTLQAQLELQHVDLAKNRQEQIVKASPEFALHIRAMVEARHRANVLKINLENARMAWQDGQSEAANRRREMSL